MTNVRRFSFYKKNLGIVTENGQDFVLSYTTKVAKINHESKTIEVLGYWSRTTSKHINSVARLWNYERTQKSFDIH